MVVLILHRRDEPELAVQPAANQTAGAGAGHPPPPDRDGLTYSADLLTLPNSAAPDPEETR
jgi:hypothetical protein